MTDGHAKHFTERTSEYCAIHRDVPPALVTIPLKNFVFGRFNSSFL